VACQHCQAEFVADPGEKPAPQAPDSKAVNASDALMLRVEQVLEKARKQDTVSTPTL
jgi:hypothetical protein